MVTRPTIADLANAAGVSVATVDRVLNRRLKVSDDTAARVTAAAEAIGYHGLRLLRQRSSELPQRTFGFVLQKHNDAFYQALAAGLADATRNADYIAGKAVVEYTDELIPALLAQRIRDLAPRVDALAVVAVDHPLVNEAVEWAVARGRPVVTLLTDLTAPSRAGCVGVDRRRSGRTAAWAISRLAAQPGKVGILIGSHRYLSQEISEISFRSYMRENAPQFDLLEPLVYLDDQRISYEGAVNILASNPDLVGIYVAGGGAEGLIRALRDEQAGGRVVAVCNELTAASRSALLDGTIDLVLGTPIAAIAQRTVELLDRAVSGTDTGVTQILLPAELHVGENI
jgi:LacI family transcriptional regulator